MAGSPGVSLIRAGARTGMPLQGKHLYTQKRQTANHNAYYSRWVQKTKR